MRILRPLVCLAALCAAAPALAAPGADIGSAVTVVSIVTASLEKDERKLAVGDGVRAQELIAVDNDGRSEIELRDKTKLALGPGAKLLLDKFVYDPDLSGGAIVMNLVRGSFRFVTGVAAKPAYVIHVPTASITVRGTIFDVYVKPDNSAWLLLIEGAVEVCTSNGKCLVHDEPGKLIRILPDTVGVPVKWAGLPGKEDAAFDSAFPFVSHAPNFDPTPVFTREQIVLGTFPEKPHPDDKDRGDKNDDGNKSTPPLKTDRGDDEDKPRLKTHHVEREVEKYERRRTGANEATSMKNFNLLKTITKLKFGGTHTPSNHTPSYGNFGGNHRK